VLCGKDGHFASRCPSPKVQRRRRGEN
jgi:hypothetical protein